ncbi:MAG: hypothetical protein HC809_11515 [Gammaproteobacteria bacterium]|nr:hypothetical protein [Gammaproteobacteria bacterium]
MAGCLSFALACSGAAMAAEQAQPESIYLTRVVLGEQPIRIDGRLDEAAWQGLPGHDTFFVLEPDTLADTPYPTVVKMFYTDRGLYVGAQMTQPKETLISRLSGRDYFGSPRDEFSFTIDTSGEGRYGYWFGVALGGSISDGTVLPERQYFNEWDGPWRGASAETETGWSAEMFIPWGTVAMPRAGDVRRMGIYTSRKVAHLDQRWGYPALPFTKPKFISVLQPIELAGVAPRQQYNIYPFASVIYDEIGNEPDYKVGADVFWRPSTNAQLNATINPDFGTVESDDVVVNLSATETFFPEKRLFFVEGQEIFVATARAETRSRGVGNQGAPYTMVNTRRIGGAPVAPATPLGAIVEERDLIQPTELLGAAKVTGQFGQLRYGVLTAFENEVKFDATVNGSDINLHQDGSDYGIARVLYEDSVGGAYRALGFLSTAVLHRTGDALVQGVDWHYLTPAGKFRVEGQSFTSAIEGEDRGYGGFMDFEYTIRQGVTQRLGIEIFDRNIDINDLGFLQRNDSYRIRSAHTRTTSNLSFARDNQLDIRGFLQNNNDGYFTGGGIFIADRLTFDNLSRLITHASFFPKSYDDLNSFGNGTYRIEEHSEFDLFWESDSTQRFSYGFGGGYHQEFLGGNTYSAEAFVSWRPNERFNTELEAVYFNRGGWLLHQEGRILRPLLRNSGNRSSASSTSRPPCSSFGSRCNGWVSGPRKASSTLCLMTVRISYRGQSRRDQAMTSAFHS